MEEKDLKDLKGAIDEGIKPLKEGVEKAATEIKAVADRVAKIEALPLSKLTLPNLNSISTEYKGYRLEQQGEALREIASRNPSRFKAFANEEKANEFAKWFIASIRALKGDIGAKNDLHEIMQKAQMQEDTTTEGGYLVPPEYAWDMIQLARANSFALNECTVVNMTRDLLRLPSEATLVSVAWTAEESAATETEPTFGQLELNATRLDGYGKVTNELLQDTAIDIVGMLAEQFGYAIGQELDNQVLNGTGSPVSGVATAKAGYSVVMATTSTNFSAITGTNLSEMIYKLNSGDLANCRFIIGRLAMHYIRTLKDTTNNWIFNAMSGTTPGTIWGFPFFVSELMTNTTAVSTAEAIFGNFKKFYIGRRIGASSIDLDPYTYFKENATQFRYITRWGLGVGRTTAFVRLLTAAA